MRGELTGAEHRGHARAFSLIELLVVIGIIILLLAILLPALATAKVQARRADTTAELKGMANACEAYQTMFGFYPGPVREIDVAQTDYNSTATVGPPIAQNLFSGTQNMALGLLGAMTTTVGTAGNGISNVTMWSAVTGAAYATPTYLVGTASATGPVDMGNGNKQYGAFYAPKTADYQKVPTGGGDANLLPTLWDHFVDPLPILYFRRTPNVDGMAANMQNSAQKWASGTPNNAYLAGTNYEYWSCTTLKSPSGAVFNEAPSGTAAYGTTTMASGVVDTVGVQHATAPFPEGAVAAWSVGGTMWANNVTYGVGGTTGCGNNAYVCTTSNSGSAPTAGAALTGANRSTSTPNWNVAPSQGGFMLISAGQSRLYGNTDNIVVIGGQ
jgi:type II secretory pathway pseudopilin PulG